MNMGRISGALLLAVILSGASGVSVSAVTVDWDDLTDSQQEQAYLQLESENQALREQLAALQSGAGTQDSGQGQDGALPPAGSGSGEAAETQDKTLPPAGSGSGEADKAQDDAAGQSIETSAPEGTVKSTEAFLSDIAASFDARQEAARTHTNEEVSAMSEADMWDFRFQCAEVERPFYESYHSAQFDDLNIYYLCSEYCMGIEKQLQAEEVWSSQGDSKEADRLYTAGYYNRAYALVELCEYYGLDLAQEYQNLKNAVAQMDALSGEENRNSGVDAAKVMQVQELLNSLGFLCGVPDGIAGRQTASCIERFQNMYGYEPADGIIDDELIGQLSDQASIRQG